SYRTKLSQYYKNQGLPIDTQDIIITTEGSEGWDGTYNDEQLPSTDYWFTLDYTENGVGKQFKAHFSLIR
uniref:T9SS type B sorting domain-containing protein n=1 Tax=Flavobacterium sp. TaxID=239 RepID=UPI0040473328